jgi:hypothetical protein
MHHHTRSTKALPLQITDLLSHCPLANGCEVNGKQLTSKKIRRYISCENNAIPRNKTTMLLPTRSALAVVGPLFNVAPHGTDTC